ncbi:MAG TPA: hypothetical protein VLA66_12865, partial [Thermoanaerobaculia bacterium]|nr:hypothetical protein [Thermoanaerobaculia bacterium]
RAGLSAPPDDRLASLERAEVHRFLASLFDLALDPRLFAPSAELARVEPAAGHGLSEADRRLSLWLAESGLLDAAADAPALGAPELEELMLELALRLRLVERRPAVFDTLQGGDLLVREGAEERGFRIDAGLGVAADTGEGPRAGELLLAAGDPLDLYLAGGRMAGVVQRLSADGAPAGRVHPRSSWTRVRSRAELAASVRQRFPGFDFADFDVVARGPSGRISRIRLIDRGGASVEVSGLAVRWLLDLPDTWFTVRRTRRGRETVWQFTGRGWGHGVGLCQFGSFSMARRGLTYRDILAHYYSGATLVTLSSPPSQP